MSSFRAACIQNTASRDIAANIDWVCEHIDDAVAGGAEFIALTETVGLIEPINVRIPEAVSSEADDAGLAAFRARAAQHGVVILVGSQLISEQGRIFNRSFLLGRDGAIGARYDKLHMFDIELNNGESYLESEVIAAGDKAVLATSEWGRIGLSICYDLRFGALYRALAQAGANSSPSRLPSPRPPVRRTGIPWCAHARSKPAVSCSRPTSAGTIATSAILMDTR